MQKFLRALLPLLEPIGVRAWFFLALLILIGGFRLALEAAQIGLLSWDSNFHYAASIYTAHRVFWQPVPPLPIPMNPGIIWYGPLWEFILGLFTEYLIPFLAPHFHDPFFVRSMVNFALYPITLWGVGLGVRRLGYTTATALLAVTLLFSFIRFGGHALINTKDFPFACATLLIGLWLTQQWKTRKDETTHLLPLRLVIYGIFGILPFLLRPPAGQLFVIALGVALSRIIYSKSRAKAAGLLLIPLASATVLSYFVWPALRDHGPFGLGKALVYFLRFPWEGQVRLLGMDFPANQLPRWYPFVWVFISFPPLSFVGIAAGIGSLIWKIRSRISAGDPAYFLAFLFLLGWAGVLLKRPNLYDEDRHLLFLLAPLPLLAALGLSWIRSSLQVGLALLILLTSAADYTQWSVHSYIYKSSLLRERRGSAFMGDYWGICYNEALQAVPRFAKNGDVLVIDGPFDSMKLQWQRVRAQQVQNAASIPEIEIVGKIPEKNRSYLIAVYSRNDSKMKQVQDDLSNGRASLLWKANLPPISPASPQPPEPACLLVRYTDPGGLQLSAGLF